MHTIFHCHLYFYDSSGLHPWYPFNYKQNNLAVSQIRKLGSGCILNVCGSLTINFSNVGTRHNPSSDFTSANSPGSRCVLVG